jgi:hypothetical protein
MVDFEVLGTDQEIDTSDPVGSLLTLVYVVLGAAALFMALPIGRQAANWVNGMIASAVGTNVGDADPGMSFGSPD